MDNQFAAAPYKVMFVCAWNTCRSAMAEYIMRHLLETAGLNDKIQVDSAGCITEGGEPIGRRTGATLNENHIPFGNHVSKSFTAEHYATFDLIIALDKDVLRYMRQKFGGDPDNKIRLFKDADGKQLSVADPGFAGEHALAYAKILCGCETLLTELTKA